MIRNKREEQKPLTVFCVTIAASGHAIPLLKVAVGLEKRGHKVIYATSESAVDKNRIEYPNFQIIVLKDANPDELRKKSVGPPLELFYQTWLPDLRRAFEEQKPDIVLVDIFSVAAMEIAEEMNIKLIINCPYSLDSIIKFGLPSLNGNLGFFGLTILKPNLFSAFLQSISPLLKSIVHALTKHLVFVHSFVGLDQPALLPPNVKTIGLPVDTSRAKELDVDISKWLNNVRQRNLGIIYVTFGTVVQSTKQFVDHMYYGLKKTGMAVLWSLKSHKIPEQNDLFFVKQWLPQKDLLGLKEVKVVITHCGFGGVTETIYAEKPMLCIPVFGDQPFNAQVIEKQGLGLILRKSSPLAPRKYIQLGFTHQQLLQKLNTILQDINFELRIKKIKQIGLRTGGIQTACDWVEYVGQLGYDHLIDKSVLKVVSRNPLKWIKRILISTAIAVGVTIYLRRNPITIQSVTKIPE